MRKTESKYRKLSYNFTVDTMGYGGSRPFKIKKHKSILNKDSCNTFIINMPNHIGTHMDCPNHFYNTSKGICEYKIKDFIFTKPVAIDCLKSADELVSEDDIKRYYNILKGADMLLLRTGFYAYRNTHQYGAHNPGISPEAAKFIRMNLGNIKCLGIDSVSISSYNNRKLGREAHQIFFNDSFKSEPVRLIEDMDLSGGFDDLKEVYVFPLFVDGIDSSPCTVLGVFRKG